MAVVIATSQGYAKASFWVAGDSCTMMAWAYHASLPTAAFDYDSVVSCGAIAGSVGFSWRAVGNGTTTQWVLSTSASDDLVATPVPVVNTWYHYAVTRMGNLKIGYINGRAVIAVSSAITLGTTFGLGENGGGGDYMDGRLYGIKCWKTALTERQIRDEMLQAAPINRGAALAGVYHFDRVVDARKDLSGRGQTLTITGTPTEALSPPVPWIVGRHGRMFAPAAAAGAQVPYQPQYLNAPVMAQ